METLTRDELKMINEPIGFIPATIYLFKVNNRNTTKRREICSKLTIKESEQGH